MFYVEYVLTFGGGYMCDEGVRSRSWSQGHGFTQRSWRLQLYVAVWHGNGRRHVAMKTKDLEK